MTELLKNHLAGRWIEGRGPGMPLHDPVTGHELVRVSSDGLDLPAAAGLAGAGATFRGSGGQRAGLRADQLIQPAAAAERVDAALPA